MRWRGTGSPGSVACCDDPRIMRYVGQAYEVNVPVSDGSLDPGSTNAVIERFHEFHQRLYAHAHPDKPVEFVSGRIAAIGTMSAPADAVVSRKPRQAVPDETRPVYFDETRSFEETAIHARSKLAPRRRARRPPRWSSRSIQRH